MSDEDGRAFGFPSFRVSELVEVWFSSARVFERNVFEYEIVTTYIFYVRSRGNWFWYIAQVSLVSFKTNPMQGGLVPWL